MLKKIYGKILPILLYKDNSRRFSLDYCFYKYKKQTIQYIVKYYKIDIFEEIDKKNIKDIFDIVYKLYPELFWEYTKFLLNNKNIPVSFFEAVEATSGGIISYGQEGEDLLLSRLFLGKEQGFYIDIGAHHPIRFSNTWRLYRNGWRGINVDATPGSMEAFNNLRPDDINLEIAISDSAIPLTFYMFDEPALNTFDLDLAKRYQKLNYPLKGVRSITPCSMTQLFDNYLPAGQHIDLLSIDIEGEELRALRSNDWQHYSPDVIVLEALDASLKTLFDHPAVVFLMDQGYVPISKLANSVIMKR